MITKISLVSIHHHSYFNAKLIFLVMRTFKIYSLQFNSASQSCLTLFNPMDCSIPSFSVLDCLPEFAQTHIHWVDDVIKSSHLLSPPSPLVPNHCQNQSFSMSQVFTSGCKSIGASASASILPMNIQGWLPLGLMGLISLQSKGLSRESRTVQI